MKLHLQDLFGDSRRMVDNPRFVRMPVHGRVLAAFCQQCGALVACSAEPANLLIAEKVHRCAGEHLRMNTVDDSTDDCQDVFIG